MLDAQEPTGQEPEPITETAGGGRDYEAEIAKLRQEAAKYRTEKNSLKKQVSELSPAAARLAEIEEAQKSAEQKQAERLATLEAELAQTKAAAARAMNERKLTALAASAGVSPEILNFLDVDKFNLEDEDATLAALSALAAAKPAVNGGNPSNPSKPRQDGKMTDDELRSWLFGSRSSNIFG